SVSPPLAGAASRVRSAECASGASGGAPGCARAAPRAKAEAISARQRRLQAVDTGAMLAPGERNAGLDIIVPLSAAGACIMDRAVEPTLTVAPGYQSGFGNQFAPEAVSGALPQGRNSPQRPPYGLYAEQFSGTAFTAPRHANRRSWLYRIRPAAVHGSFRRIDNGRITGNFNEVDPSPNQLRWSPPPLPREPTAFLAGLTTLAGNGSPDAHTGCGIYWYVANRSMERRFFYDADGELLIVPQQGGLRLATELGVIEVLPLEIAVIPQGLRFRV